MEYKHKEAFCLMQYQCKECGRIDVVWNSRDGVTSFVINCLQCEVSGNTLAEMTHINWHLDKCVPDHIPEAGQRVFIDMPLNVKQLYAKVKVNKFWDHPIYPISEMHETKEKAFEAFSVLKEGEPYIITF